MQSYSGSFMPVWLPCWELGKWQLSYWKLCTYQLLLMYKPCWRNGVSCVIIRIGVKGRILILILHQAIEKLTPVHLPQAPYNGLTNAASVLWIVASPYAGFSFSSRGDGALCDTFLFLITAPTTKTMNTIPRITPTAIPLKIFTEFWSPLWWWTIQHWV